eukprot:g12587.t1
MRVVLFDLDDTLFDHQHCSRAGLDAVRKAFAGRIAGSADEIESTYRELLERMHLKVLDGSMSIDASRIERFRAFLTNESRVATDDESIEAARCYRDAYDAAYRPVPGAIELLQRVKAKHPVGIVTNHVVAEQIKKIAAIGVEPFVDELVVSEEVGVPKPDARMFETALSRLGGTPDEAVMIGDSWSSDILGATRLGIRAIWLNRYESPCPDATLATEIASLEPLDDGHAMIKLATFNLNNLFSRFNFKATINQIQSGSAAIEYTFTAGADIEFKTFKGSLIKAQPAAKTNKIAGRIVSADMDVDVLAVQEVENFEILKEFNKTNLGNLYPHRVLIEGNDPRFIDVGVLSKLPIGAVTSFQTAEHSTEPGKRVFGRDLLEIEILNPQRTKVLFTLYNTHLKSHFGDDDNGGQGKVKNDIRRRRQAEMIREIVAKRMRTTSRYAIVGDMNDPPDADPLKALRKIDGQKMVDALTSPTEVGQMKDETNPADNPTTTAWTHRYKASGVPPEHLLFDHIWLSPKLADKWNGSFVGRRKNLGGDGSDHDPAWVELNAKQTGEEVIKDKTGEVDVSTASIWETMDNMVDSVVERLPYIVAGVVVFIVFYLLAKLARRLIRKSTEGKDSANVGRVMGRLSQWVLIFAGLLVAVTVIAPSVTPGKLFATLGIGGVAIGFAFKDILQNFMAGILILLREPFKLKDQIISGDFEGTVESIETRATTIKTYDGRRVVIPNSQIYTNPVVVNTAYDCRRSQYDVGVGYGDDLRQAIETTLETVKGVDGVLSDPTPDVLVSELAGSTVNLRARWWTKPDRATVVQVNNEVIASIKEALDDAAIDMPYPTQVVLFHDQTEALVTRCRQYASIPPGMPEEIDGAYGASRSAAKRRRRGRRSRRSETPSRAEVREESNPLALFRKLFVSDSEAAKRARKLELEQQGSVLDLVRFQAKRLERSVNPADRRKLNEYLTAIREAEQRIQGMRRWQNVPKPKVDFDPKVPVHGSMDYGTLSPLMFDLLFLAIQSDSSRVFTAGYGMHNHVIELDGVTMGYHSITHHGRLKEKLRQLRIIDAFYISQLARFMNRLKKTNTPGGNLLDETMIFFGSGLGDASRHSNRDLPIILAGGGFRHGTHINAQQKNGRQTPLNNLFTTVLQRFGVEIDRFNNATGTFFQKYCVACHAGAKPKGDVRLDDLAKVSPAAWKKVYEQLAGESMPPDHKPQPTNAERRAVMTAALSRAKLSVGETSTGLRRMNKREYSNTVRDLLGLRKGTFDPGQYVYEDTVDDGFDTRADSLVISNELLLEYMHAAKKSLRHALFSTDPQRPKPRVVTVNLRRAKGTSRRYINNHRDYVICRSGGKAKIYDGTPTRPMRFPGRYTITVTASAVDRNHYAVRFAPAKGPVIMGFGVAPDERESVANKGVLQKTFTLKDNVEQTFEFDAWVDKGHFPYFSFVNGSGKPITQVRSNIRRRKIKRSAMKAPYRGPGIRISRFTIKGPFYDEWPPPSVRTTFDAKTIPDFADAEARRQLVLRFARRAFRRSVTADEIAPYLSYLDKQYSLSRDWHESIVRTFAAMMASLDFLYIREKPGALDAYALANRLSYFFWSTMPDDELLKLAESGKLTEPAVLSRQVARMLNDERSERFCNSFARQWLSLDKLGTMRPDAKGEFRVYYRNNLEPAMREETHRFFRFVLRNNRSVRDFIDSNYTFVNRPLAALYGLPYRGKGEFVRVTIPPSVKRGGLLGQASILTLSANGVETSPIERGVWVLADLLGTPPPPPPKAVPALTPDLNGAVTVRDMLIKHRNDKACMVCHRRIDPLGFALEAYDPIGRFRKRYSPKQSISTHGHYQGKDFADITELKQILSTSTLRPFTRNLIIRIAEYAKGRKLGAADYAIVQSLLDDAAKNGYKFKDIVVAIANSDLMRKR